MRQADRHVLANGDRARVRNMAREDARERSVSLRLGRSGIAGTAHGVSGFGRKTSHMMIAPITTIGIE
jgi:hypothetical protein